MTKSIIQAGQASDSAVSEEQEANTSVQIDYGLQELIFFTEEFRQVLSIPEITKNLKIVIAPVSDDGLRTWFLHADTALGYVVVRWIGNGMIKIEVDTVLQDLENSTQGPFELDCFDFAAAWIKNLATKLATIETFWGWIQVVDAAEARSKRLG